MTYSLSHPEPGQRAGADICPGVDSRGHGLTMALVHDSACCTRWEAAHAEPAPVLDPSQPEPEAEL